MIRLHVNVDHVATVRNARGTPYPDPIWFARACEQAGADGVTAHLREDRRHIRDADVEALRAQVSTLFNLEMAATPEMLAVALRVRPDVVTLVPERREERTTEGGLDVVAARGALGGVVAALTGAGVRVSLFVAADPAQLEASRAVGAAQVELHTGEYCEARGAARQRELGRLCRAAEQARALGLEVAAGHGLTRQHLVEIATLPGLGEVNIGHALVADALFVGVERAVRDYRAGLDRGAQALHGALARG